MQTINLRGEKTKVNLEEEKIISRYYFKKFIGFNLIENEPK